MAQHTVKLYATQDVTVDCRVHNGYTSSSNDNNYSGASELYISVREGSIPRNTIVKYDFSSVKYKKIQKGAYCYFNVKNYGSESLLSVYAGSITVPWDESTATGRWLVNKGHDRFWGTPSLTKPNSSGWSSFELNNVINRAQESDWKDGTNLLDNGLYFTNRGDSNNTSVFYSTEGGFRPYIEITYEDSPPLQPTPLEPVNVFVKNQENVTFAWKYNTEVYDKNQGIEIKIKHELGSWYTAYSSTTYSQEQISLTPAQHKLKTGKNEWQLRTRNVYGEWSPWSEVVTFNVIGAPDTPKITSIEQDKLSPIITWSANDQQVYQLQILKANEVVYDTGYIASTTERSHKVNMALDEGEYKARVRIKNEYDLASEWGELDFTIKSIKPPKPILNIFEIPYGLLIEINTMEIDYALVYRRKLGENKFICIGELENFQYKDYSISKKYEYFVRVFKEEAFEDSDISIAQCNLKYSTLAPVTNLEDLLVLKSNLNSVPQRDINLSIQSSEQHYTGRELPVVDYTTFKDNTYTFTFYLKEEEVEKFIDIYHLKQIVLYRDKWLKVYGKVDGVNIVNTDLEGYTVKFSVTETDYIEEVEV
ncbi:hypothetical protein [Clostridium sp. Marseille-QA1073]